MQDSILISIKKLLGIAEDNTDFDTDIIMHINTVFMILRQMGVGPSGGFSISDSNSVWSDFIPIDKADQFSAVRSYVYAKVRYIFDPPPTSQAERALSDLIKEMEYRLYAEAAWPTV